MTRRRFRGAACNCYHRWKLLGAPPYYLKIISGMRMSNNYNLNTTPVSPEMAEQIKLMILDKFLEPADSSASFVSPMFLVSKSDGSQRPILNLKNLNNYIQPMKFRLISHYNVPNFLQPGDWVAKVDLSRPYFHVPISRSHRRFLRVIYQDVISK